MLPIWATTTINIWLKRTLPRKVEIGGHFRRQGSALLPILNQDDADFPEAQCIWERLAKEQASLVTNSYVLVESLALIQNRLGMEAVHDFQESFVPLFQVVWVTEALHQMGTAALLAAN